MATALMILSCIVLTGIDSEVYAGTNGYTKESAVAYANSLVGNRWDVDYNGYEHSYDCVDIAKMYFLEVGGMSYRPAGNAGAYATTAEIPDGWQRMYMSDGYVPEPGDVAVWAVGAYMWSSYLGDGHIGVVVGVNGDTITLVDQDSIKQRPAELNDYRASDVTCFIHPDFVTEQIIASGECGAQGNNVTWTFSDKGSLVISGSGDMFNYTYQTADTVPWKDLDVKSVLINEGITSISGSSFSRNRSSIEKVTFKRGITELPQTLLQTCKNLKEVNLPPGLLSIGDRAFASCESLEYISIPEGVTTIPSDAFIDCISLREVILPQSLISIKGYAFDNCKKLEKINIPNGVTGIGTFAFGSCKSLTEIALPDDCIVAPYTFFACTKLSNIILNPTNNNYDFIDGVLYDHLYGNRIKVLWCSPLKSGAYTIPDYVTDISGGAFAFCSNLTSIEIPDGVNNIGEESFKSCTGLTSIKIPSGITKVKEYTFHNCSSLREVILPASLTTIEDKAFQDAGLTDVYYEGTAEQWSVFVLNYTNAPLLNAKMHFNYSYASDDSVANATVTGLKAKTYTGKAIIQKPVVKVAGKTLTANTDYKVSYENNKKVGTATVIITGVGAYKDSIKKTFKINPKPTAMVSASALRTGFTAKWKKQTSQTTGYQLQYSTSSSFKCGNKTVTIAKNTTVTKKVTKLKAKKKYYVRVRTYKTIGKTKYYSSWSKAKAVKTL